MAIKGEDMALIIIVIITIYFVLLAWTWQSLGLVEKTKKIMVIILGLFLIFLLTIIVFNISKSGLNYENYEAQSNVRNIIVAVFTGINGIIVMPQIAKTIDKINENEMDRKIATRRVVVITILLMICLVFECGYMRDTQEGILNIYNSAK